LLSNAVAGFPFAEKWVNQALFEQFDPEFTSTARSVSNTVAPRPYPIPLHAVRPHN